MIPAKDQCILGGSHQMKSVNLVLYESNLVSLMITEGQIKIRYQIENLSDRRG